MKVITKIRQSIRDRFKQRKGKERSTKNIDPIVKIVNHIKKNPEFLYSHADEFVTRMRKSLEPIGNFQLMVNFIFIDLKEKLRLPSNPNVYFLGDTDAEIRTEDFSVVKIYLFNNSRLNIRPGENSYLQIEAWGTSRAIIHPARKANVIIDLYDDSQATGATRIYRKIYEWQRTNDRPIF